MPTPLRRLVFSFFFFFFIFVFQGGFVLCQPSSGRQICPPSSCGRVEIKYPLWLKNSNPNPGDVICGFPDLGIDCENETAVLHAGNDTYIIDAVDYEKGIFNFLDRDLQKDSCPRARHNLTLISIDGFPLDPYDITFIRFYFNCSAEDPYFSSWRNYSLGCLGRSNGRQSFAILKEWELGFEFPLWFCEGFVESPVKKPETGYIDLGSKFPGLLKDGFNLRLSDDQTKKCGGCEKKNGTCTYVQTGRATGKYEFRCANPKQGWSLAMKISIGLGAGIGGILISSLFFFFLYKRKEAKMRPNGSKLLSWTNSLEPSSRKDLENGTDSGAPFFRYEELHDATDGFNPSNELGDGGFGTVYKGKLRDGRIVAVKRLYENNFKRVEQFMNEAAILNRLRHPNLVSLYGCTSRHSRELLLVYEFVPNGTVADHLHGHLATRLELNWPLRLRIALETATALSYLHAAEPQIIHRDIKTNNILLDANFHVKVADFGLSRLFPMDVTHVSTAPQGTPGYVDPEYHQCYQLTDKSDVYSFGVVLVELISSMPAVDITRHRNEINLSSMAVNRIQSGQLGDLVDPRLGFDSDPEVRGMVEVVAELAFRCLQSEKEMRPSMEEAVEVLLGVSDGGDKERETTEAVKKMDEVVLLKAGVPPLSPESVMHKWSSRVTTPNASE